MTIRHFIIAALLCIVCLPASAQNVVVENVEGPTYVCKGNLHDIIYSKGTSVGPSKVKLLTTTDETVVNYKDRITNMPQYLNDFIEEYVKAANTVLEGGTSWLSHPQMAEEAAGVYFYPLKLITNTVDFSFEVGSTNYDVKQKALDIVQAAVDLELDSLLSFMPYAFLSVKFDHPEVFWIGNNYYSDLTYSYSYNSNPFNGTGNVTYSIQVRFFLQEGSSFDVRCNAYLTQYNYRNPTNIARGVQLFNSSVKSIIEQCKSKSRYWMLLRMHDWITMHNCYNLYYNAGYGEEVLGATPWSPICTLAGNYKQAAPVCEGYARAMKVLCDSVSIPCILMSGRAAATSFDLALDHMWNYVQMEDGNWYVLDATYDDPIPPSPSYNPVSGYESHKWFLIGSTVEVDEDWSYLDSHPEQWDMHYPNGGKLQWEILPGPTLSESSFNLYDLNRDNLINQEDIQIMAEKIINNEDNIENIDNIEDVDGNDRITIGDLVCLINRSLQ